MKNLILVCISVVVLNATEYFGKIEPYESFTISSEYPGKIVYVNDLKEYSYLDTKTSILKIDTQDERIQLRTLKNSSTLYEDIIRIRATNYKNKSHVKQLSGYDKNQEKLIWIESKLMLENIKRDIKIKQNEINKKEFSIKEKYLSEIYVALGEYVDIGTKLYTIHDFSKSKIEVYIRHSDFQKLKEKQVYINSAKSNFSVEKISQVNDTERISTYKVVLSSVNKLRQEYYGKIVKVEFK